MSMHATHAAAARASRADAGSPDRRIAGPVKRLSPFRRFFVEVHA